MDRPRGWAAPLAQSTGPGRIPILLQGEAGMISASMRTRRRRIAAWARPRARRSRPHRARPSELTAVATALLAGGWLDRLGIPLSPPFSSAPRLTSSRC